MPREGAPVIFRIIVRAGRTGMHYGHGVYMSEMSIETLSCPVWERSLCLVVEGAEERRVRNARQSAVHIITVNG